MILATELRIGNWVRRVNETNVLKVEMIDSSGNIKFFELDEHLFDLEESGIKPISLTPEVLTKCGFKKVEHPTSVGREGDIIEGYDHYEDEQENYCLPFKNDELLNGHNPIKYLHILQNWYFFSTGKELIVDLE